MVLQILFFVPATLLDPTDTFGALVGRLVVSPVVKELVFSNVPSAARAWVDAICADWPFRRIIPCHFDAPVAATEREFKWVGRPRLALLAATPS